MTTHAMRRRRLDVVLMVAGVAVLVTSAMLARWGVYRWEVTVFQAINGLPGGIQPFLWVLNQYGTAITIPVATAAAELRAGVPRQPELARAN